MATSLILYNDLIEHLLFSSQGPTQEAALRDVKQSVQTAYRDLPFLSQWTYYHKYYLLRTIAPQTNTYTYVHATKTLTFITALSSGLRTSYIRIKIGEVIYPVASYTNTTTVVLGALNPGANVTTAAACTVFQSEYALPSDFRNLNRPFNEAGSPSLCYVSPTSWVASERWGPNSGLPQRYTILADDDVPGGFMLVFDPYPSTAATIAFVYERNPRRMRLTGIETASRAGTVTCSASTAVAGVSTTFDSGMVDAWIRFGTSSAYPTGLAGSAPYIEQAKVKTVTDATNLVLYSAPTGTYSAVKYLMSDEVDVSVSMETALKRLAEKELAIARGEQKSIERASALADMAIRQAQANDVMNLESDVADRTAQLSTANYGVDPTTEFLDTSSNPPV